MRHMLKLLNLTGGLAVVMASGLLVSCTKEVPYKETFKDKTLSTSAIDTNAEYVYVASTDASNHDSLSSAGARPYWQGLTKLVKFRFTENNLQVYETIEDERQKNNKMNDKLVMEIPVKYVDYRCAEDRYRKCTNKEEENNEITWNQKNNFVPDFGKIKFVETNILPVEVSKVFGESCYTETTSEFLNYDLTPDSLNIQIAKTFTGNAKCLIENGTFVRDMKDLETRMIYHYSFARRDKMVTTGYQKVDYPERDEKTFGYFTTEMRNYDVDYTKTEKTKTVLMNRWNPERSEIVYYLSESFKKPEFAAIKKATQLAFDKTNAGLTAAGVKMRLVLKDPDNKIVPGDIRHNMIVMVEDPTASGPMGYGPSVVDPRTGEIMSARTVMYYGNTINYIQYAYDEFVKKGKATKPQKAPKTADADTAKVATTKVALKMPVNIVGLSQELAYEHRVQSWGSAQLSGALAKKAAVSYQLAQSQATTASDSSAVYQSSALAGKTGRELDQLLLVKQTSYEPTERIAVMSKYCNYPAEMVDFDEAVYAGLKGKLGENLKRWIDLSTEERQEVINQIAPFIWTPTLIHELGHNLGLRHNFAGSEDKENFYTKEELAQMGVTHEVPYSSVMDYGYSELNLLPTLGKYDIAALRFAYLREVENKSGRSVPVQTTLKSMSEVFKKETAQITEKRRADLEADKEDTWESTQKILKTAEKSINAHKFALKDFKYCSDEYVDVNPNCKRFDKGTNVSEIIDNLIQRYDDFYERRNFRNGRESFSLLGDPSYQASVRAMFEYIRAPMDRYTALINGPLKAELPQWTKEPTMIQLKEAAIKSAKFFIRVLKTPDLYCAIAKKSDPGKIVEVGRLQNMSDEGMDCFKDAQLNNQFMVIGQFGKLFNSRKDKDSDNTSADEIDVRGIWMDKLLAAEMLLGRRIGNSIYDKVEDNYLDMPEVMQDVANVLQQLLLNQMRSDIEVRNKDGEIIYTEADSPNQVFSTPDEKPTKTTHWLVAPMFESLAKRLGVPMERISFQQMLLNIMQENMDSGKPGEQRWASHTKQNRDFMDMFKVIKTSRTYQANTNGEEVGIRDQGTLRIIATKENEIAQVAIGVLETNDMLGKFKPEELQELIDLKEGRTRPTDLLSGLVFSIAQQSAGNLTPEAQAEIAKILPGGKVDPNAKLVIPEKFNTPQLKAIPVEAVKAYKAKALPAPNVVDYLLTILPASN